MRMPKPVPDLIWAARHFGQHRHNGAAHQIKSGTGSGTGTHPITHKLQTQLNAEAHYTEFGVIASLRLMPLISS